MEHNKIIMHGIFHPGPHMKPIPPHERNAMLHISFDEKDWEALQEVFGDTDSAVAAANIIMTSPPEMQILAIQTLKMIEEVI